MRIVADENMALVRQFFADMGELDCVAGRQMVAAQVQSADVLLVRSVTRVDAALLNSSQVRFVGSATIGADHLDLDWLAQRGIVTTTAPGCNARSVVDYVLTVLLSLSQQQGFDLSGKVLGVVGLGNVGYLLATVASSLGLTVMGCDPLVTRAGIRQAGLEQLLAEADIVCLHTPLTRHGPHPTWHMLHAGNLPLLRKGAILLNAGRGAAIDNQALLQFLRMNPEHLSATVLDVWENEPLPDRELLAKVTIATPHIAGYSLEGKWRGTEMVYQAFCRFARQTPQHTLADFLPPPRHVPAIRLTGAVWADLHQFVSQAYPIYEDDRRMRETLSLPEEQRAQAFDRLRKDYWPRRDFSAYVVDQPVTDLDLRQLMEKMGFNL